MPLAYPQVNRKETNKLWGSPVQYGFLVQLLHVKSNKYLTTHRRLTAVMERHALRLTLSKSGNEGSWYVGRKSKQTPPLATKNLLEDTDGCGSPLLLLTAALPWTRFDSFRLMCARALAATHPTRLLPPSSRSSGLFSMRLMLTLRC